MTFTYNEREMRKIRIIQKFIDWVITLQDTCDVLGRCERTIYRYKETFLSEWPPWLVHGLKNRPWNHNPNTSKYNSIIPIITKPKFAWFWPTLLAEKLEEVYNITINHESLRQIMIKQWLWLASKRKMIIARQKRERRPWYGMLIQFDWSYHDWIENWEMKCLLVAIDDATSKVVFARFVDWESLKDIYEFWKEYMKRFGKPKSVYLDRHASYKVNHPNDQFDYEIKTRFQRAMESLWISIIYSKEPEGKWRVERWFWTHQDRLVKEMRFVDILCYDDANDFLEKYYIQKHNNKFSVIAKETWDFHTELTDEEFIELEWIFAKVTNRTLRRDGTIAYMNKTYQILRNQTLLSWYTITVKESIYGHIRLFTWTKELLFTETKYR
jgi:hypothetical protein